MTWSPPPAAIPPGAPLDTVLVLEPVGGIAGDMLLAALLHLGHSLGQGDALRARLQEGLAALAEAGGTGSADLGALRIAVQSVEVSGVLAMQVDVQLSPEMNARQQPHRPVRALLDLVGRAALPAGAKDRALAVFGRLARAEGTLHGQPPDDVELHEAGALDALVDVVGASILLDALAPARVLCLPPPAGGGTVQIGRAHV
jgi:uncharacterized protein (DUF111 family)